MKNSALIRLPCSIPMLGGSQVNLPGARGSNARTHSQPTPSTSRPLPRSPNPGVSEDGRGVPTLIVRAGAEGRDCPGAAKAVSNLSHLLSCSDAMGAIAPGRNLRGGRVLCPSLRGRPGGSLLPSQEPASENHRSIRSHEIFLIMTSSSIYPNVGETSTSLGSSRSCRGEAISGFVLLKDTHDVSLPAGPLPDAHPALVPAILCVDAPHSSRCPSPGLSSALTLGSTFAQKRSV